MTYGQFSILNFQFSFGLHAFFEKIFFGFKKRLYFCTVSTRRASLQCLNQAGRFIFYRIFYESQL